MTRIYKPTLADGSEWALPVNGSDNTTILEGFGQSVGKGWTQIRTELLRHDEHGHRLREVDMPWLGNHLLILKPRAVSALGELCWQAGELLPLTCDCAELVAWNVTTVIDALDQKKSKLKRFRDGGVMDIKEYFFKPQMVEGTIAFRIPEIRSSIFVGSELVNRAKEAKLTGTDFLEVWPIN